jgi:hypothetical protein
MAWTTAPNSVYPDWLEIDFTNALKALSEVVVFSVQDNPQAPLDPDTDDVLRLVRDAQL